MTFLGVRGCCSYTSGKSIWQTFQIDDPKKIHDPASLALSNIPPPPNSTSVTPRTYITSPQLFLFLVLSLSQSRSQRIRFLGHSRLYRPHYQQIHDYREMHVWHQRQYIPASSAPIFAFLPSPWPGVGPTWPWVDLTASQARANVTLSRQWVAQKLSPSSQRHVSQIRTSIKMRGHVTHTSVIRAFPGQCERRLRSRHKSSPLFGQSHFLYFCHSLVFQLAPWLRELLAPSRPGYRSLMTRGWCGKQGFDGASSDWQMSLQLDPQHTHTCNTTFQISGSGLHVNQCLGLDDDAFNQSATAVLFTQLGTTALQTPS